MSKSQGSPSKNFDISGSKNNLKSENKSENRRRLSVDENTYWALKADAARMQMEFNDYLQMLFLEQICKYQNTKV